ncbi:MAG: UDP-glucose--hexose-1-phosphate uridylyltransferase [bacterium]|nr:MAG: UDP-glucose--hexose-1-phosphate uridylyltransferase [bacterium]
MNLKINNHPHRRYNQLNGDWVLVSPHRTRRPWQGQQEVTLKEIRPQYDPECYLCPGNQRAGGNINPKYTNTFVFTNDFTALLPDTPDFKDTGQDLFRYSSVTGTSRVICFSPRHDLTLAEMTESDIVKVIDLWSEQIRELGQNYEWVQVFENKGEIMGCSNPHPHGQIWASNTLPVEPYKENRNQVAYYKKNKSVLLLDYLYEELKHQERIIIENQYWVVLTPFWAVWPFETLLLPKRQLLRLSDTLKEEREALAQIMKGLLCKYDNLFNISFPYTMGWHGAPFDKNRNEHWHLHAHFYPPLLRSATIKKFMVGYEMLSEAQRDITAEQAAERLRNMSDIHFKLGADK